jgi:hypothetical protein
MDASASRNDSAARDTTVRLAQLAIGAVMMWLGQTTVEHVSIVVRCSESNARHGVSWHTAKPATHRRPAAVANSLHAERPEEVQRSLGAELAPVGSRPAALETPRLPLREPVPPPRCVSARVSRHELLHFGHSIPPLRTADH